MISNIEKSQFPRIPNLPINFGIPEILLREAERFPNCASRALCAVAFAQASQSGSEFYSDLTDEKYEQELRDAYFRAALAEFVSLEEVFKADVGGASISASPLKIYASNLFLPIIFKEFRNLNFHVTMSRIKSKSADVKIRMTNSSRESSPSKLPIYVIQLDHEDFCSLKNVKNDLYKIWTTYPPKAALKWFDERQSYAGAHRLFNRAVVEYLDHLVQKLSSKSLSNIG